MSDDSRLADLCRRVERDPMSIAFAALAEEYRRRGRLEQAVAVCRAGLERHPSYLSARVTLGRALLDLGDVHGAETELQQVLSRAPDNLAAIRALADIHERRQRSSVTPTRGPAAPSPNVIPFGTDPMRTPADARPGSFLPADFEIPAAAPVLTSLDRFLDAIVRLKRAAV